MIRQMESSDVEACARIIGITPFFQDYGFSADAAQRSLNRGLTDTRNILRVLEHAGDVGGFAWFVPNGAFDRSGYLRLLAVHPEHAGKGMGRLLMANLEDEFLQANGIVLLVTESNDPARRFYSALGYTDCGVLRDYVRPGVHERMYFKQASN